MPPPRLSLHSEPYATTGNIGDSGLAALLGTPGIDLAQTVVREALQNCCDAAKRGMGPDVQLRLRTLTEEERSVMAECVFADLPAGDSSRESLTDFLKASAPRVLEIADFGTTGLGGPTRADRIPTGETDVDFINFLRNVGSARDTRHGGGTYGFGKVSLYLAGRARTVLVDTLAVNGGRRFMGCHLGPAFQIPEENGTNRRYTGRHWWGLEDTAAACADPLSGEGAAELAAALGLPERSEEETGTTIMILDPLFAGEDLEATAKTLIECVLFNFWPRMMRDVPEERRLRVEVKCEGKRLDVPAPEEFPPLDLFCSAMRDARSANGNSQAIRCQRPQKLLGQLAIAKGLRSKRHLLTSENETLFFSPSAHIAVMRPAEMVVRYFAGDPMPDDRLEWAGVFLVDEDDEVEKAFAKAEPPSHDDWKPESLERGRARTFVNVALREIKAGSLRPAKPPVAPVTESGEDVPLAVLAGKLGAFLTGTPGEGGAARRGASRPGRGGKGRKASVSRPEFRRLEETGDGVQAIFACTIKGAAADDGWRLSATPSIALDGSAAPDFAEVAAFAPTVVAISNVEGEKVGASASAAVADGVYEIAVRFPPDGAVFLKVDLEQETAT